MADPKDLQKAADAIRSTRGLPALVRHRELDEPLRQAEEWPEKNIVKSVNGTATGTLVCSVS